MLPTLKAGVQAVPSRGVLVPGVCSQACCNGKSPAERWDWGQRAVVFPQWLQPLGRRISSVVTSLLQMGTGPRVEPVPCQRREPAPGQSQAC